MEASSRPSLSLEQFPTELLTDICKLLIPRDVACFRLVCRIFGKVGAEYLCPELLVFLKTLNDHRRLTALSQQPHISGGLRRLNYVSETFAVFRPTHFGFGRDTRLLSQRLHQRQLELKRKHWAILMSNIEFAILSNALPTLARLRHVSITFDNRRPDLPGSTFPPEGLATRVGRWRLEALLRALSKSGRAIDHFTAKHMDWRFFDRDDALMLNLFAPLAAVKHLELQIHCGGTYYDLDDGMTFTDEFHALRRTMKTGAVGKALSVVKCLRTLSIEFDNPGLTMNTPLTPKRSVFLKEIIPSGLAWPTLRSLTLKDIVTERGELMKLLLLHKEILRELRLTDIYLASTSWIDLLSDIRHQLYLTDPRIWGYMEGHHEDGDDAGERQTWKILMWPEMQKPEDIPQYVAHGDVRKYLLEGGKAHPKQKCPLVKHNFSF
ncbi:Uu.00g100180.m01.CDS01 [Anthostomella pinea]|uniref:Uu.00g100180.m01.CDS01 n=1 Tax=Anthostomella pinea TaxID=933095 RepID=A0AAI8YFF2_9PEZI|nr:Uu.00g100180.m01.CDS01 [Anthostomella pinea]